MWIADYCFVDCISAFLLPIDYFEPECSLGDAINLTDKIPALIVKEGLAIGYEELKVTNLRRVDGWIVNLSYASMIECVPYAAGS